MTPEERMALISTRRLATGRFERLWARNEWRPYAVWQVPTEALLLNVDNRRFVAERKLIEEKLGHDLDPENNPGDDRALEVILLDKSVEVDGDTVLGTPGKDYEALKTDWRRRRQESALWIRPDGVVRNGNRRLAMLRRMQRDEGLDGLEYVDAVILEPAEIDEVALFDMEQREQLTENLKVRYTDINLLLAIRAAAEARAIDWYDQEDLERVAGELQHIVGNDRAYALVQLNAIKYMDAYLDDSGEAGHYQKLIGQIERFRDVGRAMSQIEADYTDDAPEALRLMFAAIRAGLPHGRIRDIRRMFRHDRQRHRALVEAVNAIESHWEESGNTPAIADPEVVIRPEDDDQALDEPEADPPGPNVPNYPRAEIARAVDEALDEFEASQNDDVLQTLRQVLNRLDALTDERQHLAGALGDPNVRGALVGVFEWADRHRRLIDEQ
jgi:hypothetical protein